MKENVRPCRTCCNGGNGGNARCSCGSYSGTRPGRAVRRSTDSLGSCTLPSCQVPGHEERMQKYQQRAEAGALLFDRDREKQRRKDGE